MDLGNNQIISDLGQNEKIIKVIHRHWFNILQQYFVVFGMAAALAGGFFIPGEFFAGIGVREYQKFLLFAESLVALFLWLFSFLVWIDYYFDIWIITSDRIINIEQKGLFVRQVSELKIRKIQDVTANVAGPIPTVLNFGDLHIQTAAEESKFIFRKVGDPYHLKTIIMDLQQEAEKEATDELGEMIEKKIHAA